MKYIKKIILLISLIFVSNSFSQEIKEKNITIKVTDAKNKPVPLAIILFDNVRQQSWTNKKGIYSIKVKVQPKKISAFSSKIGISTILYDGKEKVTIQIKKGRDKNKIFSKNTLNPKQFRNIYDYLRGKVPGVNVDGNNEITIRGYNSINGSTTPLFIVNNNQVDQATFGNLISTDIKSIRVLKGPESAKFGSRGANGVIIVTTK